MATFNGGRFIREQLVSVFSCLPVGAEVIVSDDGSSDDTLEILRSFKDQRLKVISGPKKGVIPNFENALNHANGDVIFLCDQDDVWQPNKVSVCMETLKHCDLVISDAHVVNENLDVKRDSFFKYRNSINGVMHNLYQNSFLGCCMAFNRNILDASLPFPDNIPMHDWWIGLLANSIGNVRFIDKKLILYRRHSENASDTSEKSTSSLVQKILWRLRLLYVLTCRVMKLKYNSF